MLVFNLDNVLKIRGVIKPYAYIRKLGFSHDLAHRIAAQKVKGLKFDQMERLCTALYCTPNDLMEWQGNLPDSNHPLATMTARQSRDNMLDRLVKLPLDKLEKLTEVLEQMD